MNYESHPHPLEELLGLLGCAPKCALLLERDLGGGCERRQVFMTPLRRMRYLVVIIGVGGWFMGGLIRYTLRINDLILEGRALAFVGILMSVVEGLSGVSGRIGGGMWAAKRVGVIDTIDTCDVLASSPEVEVVKLSTMY